MQQVSRKVRLELERVKVLRKLKRQIAQIDKLKQIYAKHRRGEALTKGDLRWLLGRGWYDLIRARRRTLGHQISS